MLLKKCIMFNVIVRVMVMRLEMIVRIGVWLMMLVIVRVNRISVVGMK